jgi:hypothetical protein
MHTHDGWGDQEGSAVPWGGSPQIPADSTGAHWRPLELADRDGAGKITNESLVQAHPQRGTARARGVVAQRLH